LEVSLIRVAAKLAIVLFWLFFIVIVAGSYLPFNPFTPPAKAQIIIKTLFPQGWGFFTKGPKDKDVYLYTKKDGKLVSVLSTPYSSSKNLFGLRRDSRTQGAEYGLLLSQINAEELLWSDCINLQHLECLQKNDSIKAHEVINTSKHKSICGEVWIIIQGPIPWAWSHKRETINMPIKFIRINVNCNKTIR
jgi:antimicrobial peptide system SdpA family protein